MENGQINTVDAYIAQFPTEVGDILTKLRALIQQIAPEATEKISYGMPGYFLHKAPLVYFAAFKNHIGLYATPSGHAAFQSELLPYKQGKGSVQFPLNQEFPWELVSKIVQIRVQENQNRGK